jgi:hypothetical protein
MRIHLIAVAGPTYLNPADLLMRMAKEERRVKIAREPYRDRIANFEQVRETPYGIRFASPFSSSEGKRMRRASQG